MRFTREPAAWGAAVIAVISAFVTFDTPFLNTTHEPLVVAVVNGIVGLLIAWRVRPMTPTTVTYLISALAALAIGYGVDIPGEWVSGANTLIVALFFAATRVQQTPVDDPAPTTPAEGPVR